MKAWTKAEEMILKQYYPSLGKRHCAALLTRTHNSIKRKAAEMGLKTTKLIKQWSDAEEQFLIKNYPKYGSNFCSQRLNIGVCIVYNKIEKLHLKKDTHTTFKICTKCNIEKSVEQFPNSKTGRLGKNAKCKRCKNDIIARIQKRTRELLKSKEIQESKTALELLGCSKQEFIAYFKSKMKPDMTWEAVIHGRIHIDHIKPCCSFDLTNPAERAVCFHYTNLQPLWAVDNLKKGAKCSTLQSA